MSRRCAVVTGASAGIGRATAARFVEDGWRVWNVARRASRVPGVVDLPTDLADPASVEAAAEQLVGALEGAEAVCLVHNAAVMPDDGFGALDPAVMAHALQVNVVAPATLTSRLRARLVPGSSVIFVGSTLSEKAVPRRASYVASKHAIVGLTRAAVQDFFGAGVHAVCVCPGFTDTEMLRPVLDASPGLEGAVTAMVAFGRLLRPEEVADVIAFAARTPALNGAIVHANLGQREA